MKYSDAGCGRTDAELILYEVSPLRARPLTRGFTHLFCGYRPDSAGVDSEGIILCPDCAVSLGLPPLTDSGYEPGYRP